LLTGAASAPQAAVSGFSTPYTIPDTATAVLGVLLAVAVLATVGRTGVSKQAGWWLIGALLARSLAEYHYDAGAREAFGVVVPYRAQVDATQAALDDSSLGRATPVGTSHKFQGRQFDTVLADLVEDGYGRVATADLRGNDFAIDSVRLFNVAATRPRSRLYVLVWPPGPRSDQERPAGGPAVDGVGWTSPPRRRRFAARHV
jgi:AAA domain